MNGLAERQQLSGDSDHEAAPPTRDAVLEIVAAAAVLLFNNGQTTERMVAAAEAPGRALGVPLRLHPNWHPAKGPGVGAEHEAFRMLSELTTAGPQLLALAQRDRTFAVKERARDLEFVRQQFEATAALEDTLATGTDEGGAGAPVADADDLAFGRVRDALVDRAGGTLSLTEATELLGVSRQVLHKRIVTGTALGMMLGNEIAVPSLQIAERGGRHAILPGIGAVTKLFKQADAGPWMASQFLFDSDPNLNRAPIEVPREGDERSVVRAARAHLHLDEG
jgi:hypothetical protein